MSEAPGLPDTCGSGNTCPRCGEEFRCGVEATGCWCAMLPPIDPLAIAALDKTRRVSIGLPAGPLPCACLCPACLASLIRALGTGDDASETARPRSSFVTAHTPSRETLKP